MAFPEGPEQLLRRARVAHWRAGRLDPAFRGLLWMLLAGLLFTALSANMRLVAQQLHPFEVQFLRYLIGLAVVVPLFLRGGAGLWRPRSIRGQFTRGALHTVALSLWFLSIPHVSLGDITALGFTTPLFVMLGAVLFLGERLQAARAVAAALGMTGVVIVVWPQLSGQGGIWLLALLSASPIFAASFLITKAQTAYERPEVIVAWQALTVSLLSLPMALVNWQWPTAGQWILLAAGGLFGSLGNYALTRALMLMDVSATQTVRFLELVWALLLGWLLFGDSPSRWTVLGGLVICGATVWITRREASGSRRGGL
jgi:drug/metabolite transporter (DMT)-like permease